MNIFKLIFGNFTGIRLKTGLTVSLLLVLASLSHAQTTMYIGTGCAVDDAEMGQTHYVFNPSNEADQIIGKIMRTLNLEPNFVIKSGDVKNAVATEDNNQRFIIYNTAYVERIKHSAGSDWPAVFLFAHEIAHHLNSHHFKDIESVKSKEQELKADWFAGGILFRLGATLDQAQQGIGLDFKESGSKTHPPRRARLEAIASGWKNAQEESGGLQPKSWFNKEQTETRPSAQTDTYADPLVGKFVLVRGGTFSMGCTKEQQGCGTDESPVHQVTLSDYYIGETEITQTQWKAVMGSNPSGFSSCDECPVESVSWLDVEDFLLKLNARSGGIRYRLPTEAEWEYAARGGSLSRGFQYSGGNIIDDVAWYNGNTRSRTRPVKLKESNELGLFDMSGNVWEWCSDWFDNYPSGSQTNPRGGNGGSYRVLRGGSWGFAPQSCRVADRYYNAPDLRYNYLGFRLARTK